MDKYLEGIIVNEIYSQFPYCVVDISHKYRPINQYNDIFVRIHFLHLGDKKCISAVFTEDFYNIAVDKASFIKEFVKRCLIQEIEKLQEELDD